MFFANVALASLPQSVMDLKTYTRDGIELLIPVEAWSYFCAMLSLLKAKVDSLFEAGVMHCRELLFRLCRS